MRIKNISFAYENRQKNDLKIKTINKMEIVFKEGLRKPVVHVEVDDVRIEDANIDLDVSIILDRVGQLNFDEKENYSYPREFCCSFWKLVVNDNVYEGDFEIPFFVSKVKKIIKCDMVFDIIRKKVINYLK